MDLGECSVFVAAALLKDLLRSLPDCLLMCGHYAEWIQLAEAYADNKVVDPVKRWVSFARRAESQACQLLHWDGGVSLPIWWLWACRL